MTESIVRCGTISGWSKHVKSGEKPCYACALAKKNYDARWRVAPRRARLNRLHARAQARANKWLKDKYPEDYREFYEQAKREVYEEAGEP